MHILGVIKPEDKKAVAVVGTRQMSIRGRKLTENFVRELVLAGYTIVSGLARGVDTVAHETALKSGGRTIAVLGSGMNTIYPPENKLLAEKIIESGALVSLFLPNTKPLPKNFLARNKIIVELSQVVLVVEGARRSGTLSTAAWAANAGKEVFAIPGSEATDWLIAQGATIANDPSVVIEYLNAINNC